MFNDVRYAPRSFRRTPGFTTLVIATLAIVLRSKHRDVFGRERRPAAAVRVFRRRFADAHSTGTSHPDLVDISRRATTIAASKVSVPSFSTIRPAPMPNAWMACW